MQSEEDLIEYALTFPGACVRYPYGNSPMVLSTAAVHEFCEVYEGTKPLHLVMKCNPERAELLRRRYPNSIKPGFKCNKRHWNSVFVTEELPEELVRDLLYHSFQIVNKRK